MNISGEAVVILSTADWDAALWTNKQHIASRLAADRDVYYINSLGLRAPRPTRSDLGRVLNRMRRFRKRSLGNDGSEAQSGHGPRVVNLWVFPWHGNQIIRAVNTVLIRLQSRVLLPPTFVLWTFSPLSYGLEERAVTTVYHSVDLLHTLPGLPRRAILKAETVLLARAGAVIASSRGVMRHLHEQGRADVLLWENVADVELFYGQRQTTRRREAVFAGNLTPTKLDIELLLELANHISIVLIGPSEIDGVHLTGALEELLSHTSVRRVDAVGQQELARLLGGGAVGLIPYRLNEYTSGVFPMKVYEYLAAGMTVVSTPLDSLSSRHIPGLHLADSELFVESVLLAIDEPTPIPLEQLVGNSWEARLKEVRALLDQMAA